MLLKPRYPVLNRRHSRANALVGGWPFSEGAGLKAYNWADPKRNAVFGSSVTWVSCSRGVALNFSGTTSQRAFVPGLTMQFISCLATIKTTDAANIEMKILDRDSAGGGTSNRYWQFRLDATNRILRFTCFNDAGSVASALNAASLADGREHRVAGTWDGVNISVYVDGVLAGQTAFSGILPQAAGTINIGIGGSTGSFVRPWIGIIDAPMIYSVALSADEIARDARDPFAIYRAPLRRSSRLAA